MASHNKNRSTTLDSLEAALELIYCETKEEFCYYYWLATKDNCGATIWFHIQRGK